MHVYKVTPNNRRAVYGLIKKFMDSCAIHKHIYRFNGLIVFPYLTDEHIKNGKFAIPFTNTCKFNGVRAGDTVAMYGGNRITIRGHNGNITGEFIRVVPKHGEDPNKLIELLSKPMSPLRNEFMFDRVCISKSKKTYTQAVMLKF